jgi:hypothetical protein
MIRIAPSLRIIAYAFPLCFFLGALIALGAYPYVAILLAPIGLLAVLSRARFAVWATLVGALVVSGLTQLYFPQYQAIRWLVSLLGIAVGGVVMVQSLWEKRVTLSPDTRHFFLWAAALLGCAFLGNMLESGSISVAVIGLKSYFQFWGLLLAIVFMGYTAKEAGRFIYFLLGLALIQWPFALHQYLVLVPKRTNDIDAAQGVVPVDIVSGTFGGNLHGGGLSMDSALLAAIAIAILLALWRVGRLTNRRALMATAFIMFPMAINESKVIVVFLPLALFTVFRDKLLKNPLQFVGGSIIAVAAVASLLVGYTLLPNAGVHQGSARLDKFYEDTIAYNFGELGYGRNKLNRSTVYRHWFVENVMHGDFDKVLIGYGAGATNNASVVSGDESLVTKRYVRYGIGLTGLSTLLWEVGLVGVFAVGAMFMVLYRTAGRLAAISSLDSSHQSLLLASQAAIPVLALSLFVTNYFVFDLGFQAVFITITSYVLCMSNLLAGGTDA